jgi:hypothetical protein
VRRPTVERVVAEFVVAEVDQQLHPTGRQHALELMGKLALMNPERLHERKKNPIVWRSAEDHRARKVPRWKRSSRSAAKRSRKARSGDDRDERARRRVSEAGAAFTS